MPEVGRFVEGKSVAPEEIGRCGEEGESGANPVVLTGGLPGWGGGWKQRRKGG